DLMVQGNRSDSSSNGKTSYTAGKIRSATLRGLDGTRARIDGKPDGKTYHTVGKNGR
ncbi:hypothetical protein A4X13_0g8652, partial [Tilletia indica]